MKEISADEASSAKVGRIIDRQREIIGLKYARYAEEWAKKKGWDPKDLTEPQLNELLRSFALRENRSINAQVLTLSVRSGICKAILERAGETKTKPKE